MATSESKRIRERMERKAPFIKHVPLFIEDKKTGLHSISPEAKALMNLSDAELAGLQPTEEEIGDTFLVVDRADNKVLSVVQYEQMPEHLAGVCPVCDETPERGN